MQDIRHIGTSFTGTVIALAEFKKRVQVFDTVTQKVISEFDSNLDFGGQRLAISEDGNTCICGSYLIHGVCAYDTATGKLRWQRKDLKKVHKIQLVRSDPQKIFISFEQITSRIIHIATGEDMELLRGVRQYYESPYLPFSVSVKSGKYQVTNRLTGNKKLSINQSSFSTTDLSIAGSNFVAAENGGPFCCYSLDTGALLWQVPFNGTEHFLKVCYNERLDQYIGICWPPFKGGNKRIVYISAKDGTIINEIDINRPEEIAFALKGQLLITSDKIIYNLETREIRSWL